MKCEFDILTECKSALNKYEAENCNFCLHKKLQDTTFENNQLQDKLHRRNMQIKELKEELKRAYVRIADLTHPEYADK